MGLHGFTDILQIIIYEFMIGDKTYTGNSLIEVGNEERIGDSIEVLYFKHAPFFNRPTSFYEDE